MPMTINHIGTSYYGKSRIHRRKGTCAFCQRVGELQSYDTTLFFVVLFIPLIPLTRKHVLEECPRLPDAPRNESAQMGRIQERRHGRDHGETLGQSR